MKKVLIGNCLISLLITFLFFYIIGWYNFGTIPTKAVLFRMILFFLMLTLLLFIVTLFKNSKDNKKWILLIIIGCIPFLLTIIYALYTAITGSSLTFLGKQYGFSVFLDSIILVSAVFFPIYIIGIILIIVGIINIVKKSN